MRAIFFILYCFFCLPVFAKTNYVKIQTWQTKAGTPIYFVQSDALPIVDVSTIFHAGSAYDSNFFGLASLTNSFIGEQTKNLDPSEIAEKMSSLGMLFDTNTDRDKAMVHFRSVTDKKYLDGALSLYIDTLSNLSISEATFNRVKSQSISAIKSELEDPTTIALNAFFSELYGDQPYGHPIDGTITSIDSLNLRQILQFYRNYYTAKNAFICIVGDLDLNQAQQIAEKISASLPVGQLRPEPENKPIISKNKVRFIEHPGSQNTIIIGQLGIAHADQRLIPLQIANTILGDMGMGSLLMEEVRNQQGLVYYVDSSIAALKNPGPFFIMLQTKSENSAKASELTKQELLRFAKKGPSEAQLIASKKYLIGSFPFSYATNSNILVNVINIAFYHLPLDYLDKYQDRISATPLEQTHRDFAQLIQPDALITVTVGKKSNPN